MHARRSNERGTRRLSVGEPESRRLSAARHRRRGDADYDLPRRGRRAGVHMHDDIRKSDAPHAGIGAGDAGYEAARAHAMSHRCRIGEKLGGSPQTATAEDRRCPGKQTVDCSTAYPRQCDRAMAAGGAIALPQRIGRIAGRSSEAIRRHNGKAARLTTTIRRHRAVPCPSFSARLVLRACAPSRRTVSRDCLVRAHSRFDTRPAAFS